jgi:hypothetical protein
MYSENCDISSVGLLGISATNKLYIRGTRTASSVRLHLLAYVPKILHNFGLYMKQKGGGKPKVGYRLLSYLKLN